MNNKKLIRLTEGDLHNIIMESVNKILFEISDDTISSAIDASKEKINKYSKKYGSNSPVTDQAKKQYKAFDDEYTRRLRKAYPNSAKYARMKKNDVDRKNGERTYQNGVGWRTKPEQ